MKRARRRSVLPLIIIAAAVVTLGVAAWCATAPRHKVTVGLLHTLQHDEQIRQVRTVAISPDGRLIATGGYDRLVRLWDTATGAIKHGFENEDAQKTSRVPSGDQNGVVSTA